MNDIHDDFEALVKRIEMSFARSEQRNTAAAMVKQAQEWVRALEQSRAA